MRSDPDLKKISSLVLFFLSTRKLLAPTSSAKVHIKKDQHHERLHSVAVHGKHTERLKYCMDGLNSVEFTVKSWWLIKVKSGDKVDTGQRLVLITRGRKDLFLRN